MRTSDRPTECTFEIRFRPNPVVLDVRGSWAADISAHLGLPQWNIVDNRVDIFSPDRQDHAFVSFRNAGMVIQNPPTANYFSDKAQRFLKRLLSYPELGSPLFVERVGVRVRQAVACDMPFESLVSQLATSYIRLAPELEEALDGARLDDLAAPLNLIDAIGHFHTVVGPMKEPQFKENFRTDQKLPEVGVFVDVDYWEQPARGMTAAELTAKLSGFASAADKRSATLRDVALARVHVEA